MPGKIISDEDIRNAKAALPKDQGILGIPSAAEIEAAGIAIVDHAMDRLEAFLPKLINAIQSLSFSIKGD